MIKLYNIKNMRIKKHIFPTVILGGILLFGLLLNPAFVGALIIVTGPTTTTTTHPLCHDSSCTTTTTHLPTTTTTTRPPTTTTTTHPLCHDSSCTTTTTVVPTTTTTTHPLCHDSSCTRYSCNTSTYQCYVNTNGAYATLNDCTTNCQPPVTRYACNSSYQCVVASNGEYTSLSTCQNNCIAPARYTCNANYQCVSDSNGQYTSLNTCQNNCIAPARYTCNANYQCVSDSNGQYTSLNTCQNNCQPPVTRYSCNANYQCVVASNGQYTSLNTCQNNCQQIIQSLSVSCYASPNYPQVNQTITFYSNVSGGSGNYTYYWSGYASGNGSSSQQTFSSSGTYSANLMVYDSNSRSGSASCSAYVQGQSTLTPTLNFWADKYTLNQGEATYLRWTSSNTNYCVASNGWTGSKSTSNYESTAPNNQTTYTLTCYGNGGQVTQSLTLYVASPTTTINFTKLGRNLSNGDRIYSKVIRVAQGDIIEFYLTVTAGSSSDLQNVVITDNLPSVFSYQNGTTKVDGITQIDTLTTTGLSLGTISRGTSKTIVFQALSNNPGTYFTYTNTAQVTASGVSTISDNATIIYGLVAGASTIKTGAEDSLWISFIISMGLAFLIWYYVKFNPQGKLVFAKVENKIRDLRLDSLRRQIIKK